MIPGESQVHFRFTIPAGIFSTTSHAIRSWDGANLHRKDDPHRPCTLVFQPSQVSAGPQSSPILLHVPLLPYVSQSTLVCTPRVVSASPVPYAGCSTHHQFARKIILLLCLLPDTPAPVVDSWSSGQATITPQHTNTPAGTSRCDGVTRCKTRHPTPPLVSRPRRTDPCSERGKQTVVHPSLQPA